MNRRTLRAGIFLLTILFSQLNYSQQQTNIQKQGRREAEQFIELCRSCLKMESMKRQLNMLRRQLQ